MDENMKLTDEYKRITEQFKDLQSKFRHFELVDTKKYNEVWAMKEAQVGDPWTSVDLEMSRILVCLDRVMSSV
jgi:hypothetical protein